MVKNIFFSKNQYGRANSFKTLKATKIKSGYLTKKKRLMRNRKIQILEGKELFTALHPCDRTNFVTKNPLFSSIPDMHLHLSEQTNGSFGSVVFKISKTSPVCIHNKLRRCLQAQ